MGDHRVSGRRRRRRPPDLDELSSADSATIAMQIGDRVRYLNGTLPDEMGLITAVSGDPESGLTLDILLDTGRQIRVVASTGWTVAEDD